MPARLTEIDLNRHVGARFAKRARLQRVDDPAVDGVVLTGRVGPYQVQAELADRLTSRCTCIYGERCEHVAALLAAWIDDADGFERLTTELALPESPHLLRAWLASHDPALLAEDMHAFLDHGRWMSPRHPLWSLGRGDLDTALDALELAVEQGKMDAREALEPLFARVTSTVRMRMRKREAVQRASAWRDDPPPEPALRPLWEAARAALADLDLARFPPGSFGRAQVLPDHELRFALQSLPYHPVTRPIAEGLLESLDTFLRRDVAGVVLDSVVGHHQPDVREEVLAVLKVPLWQRALEQLDRALALEGPRSAQEIGWRVETLGPFVSDATLVGLTPYKRRDGFRTKKLAGFEPRDLPLAADRAAHAAQKAGSPLPFVLEHLVDHPRLVDEDGLALRLKRSELEVAVRVEDGYALQLVLAGRTLSLDALPGLRPEAGQAAIRLGPVVHLVTVGPVLEGVIKMMGRYGDRFPAAARGPLLERLGLMDRSVPLRLDGSLRGRPLEPDNRPVLLLEPLPEGALRVLVRLEPLPGGPRVVPGHGPSELSVTIDGERRFVERSPSSEPSRVRDALVGLPLPELVDWEGTHELPEDALDLVWALRDNPAVRTLWPKRRLLVRGEGTASQVRASASRRRDWFGVEGELRAEQSVVPLKDLLSAIRAGQRFVELADGSWLRLADGLRKALRDASGLATDEDEPRLPPLAAARAMLALEEAGGDTFVPDELTDLADRIRAADDLEPVTPPGLQATLRDYQLAGVTWLRRLATWAPGAVLADEMGLGKTLQALALILERGGLSLVVAPASVNLNWAREAARFTPGLKVALYRGSDREALLADPPDILITSYELLIRDLDRLATVRLSTVVFDEAQALKNPRTKRARASRALDVGFALALSGTPVENDLLELWSLMRVVVPGLLGPKEHFHERFGKKLMRAESMGGGALGGLIRPFLLRRTKREVAPELPERTETVEWIELSSRERVAYDRLRLSAVSALTTEESPDRMQVLAALTRLRQVACADRLVDPEAPEESTKILRLVELVEEVVENGGAMLVFSQFTSLLDLAEAALDRRGVRTVRLDGSTPLGARQEAVDRFQARGADVFLISLKAGGTGLNLTAATTVVHLDPWWNPAAEDQASDRAHRIGQTQKVQVVRLVSAGTVEERVLDLHTEKRALAATLFEGTTGTLDLTSSDLIGLLGA